MVIVLVTVRLLPFFFTGTLIRSVTLFVSSLGVRSYSDQRYSSMQMSATRHSLGVSTERTAGFGYSFAGSDVNREVSCAGAWGGGIRRESGKGASTTGASAAEAPARRKPGSVRSRSAGVASPMDKAAGATVSSARSALGTSATNMEAGTTAGSGDAGSAVARLGTEVNAVACGASTGSRLAVSDVASRGARLSSIVAAWAFSMPGKPKAASQPAIQPARRTVPLNAARAANRCALISPIVSSLSSKAAPSWTAESRPQNTSLIFG